MEKEVSSVAKSKSGKETICAQNETTRHFTGRGGQVMSDLISRQNTIETLESRKDKTAKGDIARFYNKIIDNCIEVIMELPPSYQQRKDKEDEDKS